MRNLGIRLILWFVAVPAIVAIVLLLPQLHHLALNSFVVVVSALGAMELAALLSRTDARYRARLVAVPLLGAAAPAAQLFSTSFAAPGNAVQIAIVLSAGLVLFAQVFRHTADGFKHSLTNVASNLTLVVYPGLFLAYLIRMSEFGSSSIVILTFLCAVFFNDSMAYVAGGLYRLARQKSAGRRGVEWQPHVVLPVSPKKTIAGFVGGFLMSPVVLLASNAIFPDAIPGGPGAAVLLGSAVGAATIVGDLIESAIKRSATSKNSGDIIPGRGGILDSVDSVLYAAPVFYYLLSCIA